ncbi:hypothetical protein SRABI27_00015 [Pedobacter sp. Bi27]|uniref:DUF885 family protein n=1 Tax=unclassified Pedobacter TaxID=2628915 RepID=UPI001D62523E|nr:MULTISPECIES: DUF885 family protein [unclassified Pedobacter]CAH0129703.1 hypothetical protein SRABI126_00015 [Pedobacter sp. Bi126]CAH0130150.1 hypothetical protein SRABI27_00015 [Pedobacter sp. Bi27]CAH0228699.1 hypothetical protein SRABI36_02666 [Pedobacter sp. Bi36]
MQNKLKFFALLLVVSLLSGTFVLAQTSNESLYEQTSEMGTLIVGYQRDVDAINDFYYPYSAGGTYSFPMTTFKSPEQRKRLQDINKDYLSKLKSAKFEGFSIYGKVDYILLKKQIESSVWLLGKEETEYNALSRYFTFADAIYALEKLRRRGTYKEGSLLAVQMTEIAKQIDTLSQNFTKQASLKPDQLKMATAIILSLKHRLKGFYQFYMDYEPGFTWWAPKPYEKLDLALTNYAKFFNDKGDPVAATKSNKPEIKGSPIGREELIRQLNAELIPYTPEELILLAEKEFKFCDEELLKASAAMGFGKDWKKAQEKIKNSYVPLGKQPELIVKLQDDALSFIKANDLINIPPLAEETWGMVMMSAERQLVNPFFTGGREISISYPTNSMEEDDKLMSMRGNNPYFSRGTVQHELLPGHHYQYFINNRYKSYRDPFKTPFSVEGWPLYWELLLYDKGFAKTPEEKMGMLFWRMHRCARILFSLNFHLGKWTPQQCVDFLVDRVGHERANAEGEVRRSFKGDYSPLYQVAYLTGGLQLFALKKELVDSGKMSFKAFHDAVIKENLIPVEMIRATLTNQPLTRDFTTSWHFYGQLK